MINRYKNDVYNLQITYAVGWRGRRYQWHGDDELNEGHYTLQNDDNVVVAINVPENEAEKIVIDIDNQYDQNKFCEKLVYHKMGDNRNVIHYNGAYMIPMSELTVKDLDDVVDYSKGHVYAT